MRIDIRHDRENYRSSGMNSRHNYYLALHVETTGICNDLDRPVNSDNDIISISAAICDKRTFKVLDKKIIFIENDKDDIGTKWHGITRPFLDDEGVDEETAIEEFVNFILEYFTLDNSIICLGQNVHSFVLPFIRELLERHEVYLKFAPNSLDVFSITVPTIGETSITELVEMFGDVDSLDPAYQRVEYASMLKVLTFIKIFRSINKIWTKVINQ